MRAPQILVNSDFRNSDNNPKRRGTCFKSRIFIAVMVRIPIVLPITFSLALGLQVLTSSGYRSVGNLAGAHIERL